MNTIAHPIFIDYGSNRLATNKTGAKIRIILI